VESDPDGVGASGLLRSSSGRRALFPVKSGGSRSNSRRWVNARRSVVRDRRGEADVIELARCKDEPALLSFWRGLVLAWVIMLAGMAL
jgi:hypothetical protein